MSTESASSWERVPSDYDIVSSPTDSLSRADSPSDFSLHNEDEPEIQIAQAIPLHSSKIILQPSKEQPIFSSVQKAPVLDPYAMEWEDALKDLSMLTNEMIEETPFSKMQWKMIMLCFIGGVADGIELMCISFVLPHIRCTFGLSAVENSLLSSIGFIGLLVGGLGWGSIGDNLGRSATLSMCMAVNGIFGILTAFSTSYFSIILCRFMAGVGIGGSGLLFTYVSEISPKKRVGFYLSILATSWMLANLLASVLAYLILPIELVIGSWRIFITLCTLPAIFSSILFLTAPESPCWLASQGRVTDVISSLVTFYPQKSFKLFKTLQPYEKLSASSPSLTSFIFNLNLSSSFSQLLTQQLISRTGPLWVINFCISFGFYGLSLWLPTIYAKMESAPEESFCEVISNTTSRFGCTNMDKKQYVDSLLFAFIQFPGNLVTMYCLDKLGPRKILSVSLLFNALVTLCLLYSGSAWQSFCLSIVFSASSVFCWNALNVANTSLIPVRVRSFATGSFNASNRLGGLFGSLLIGVFIESGCGYSVLSLFTMLILGAICSTLLPKS